MEIVNNYEKILMTIKDSKTNIGQGSGIISTETAEVLVCYYQEQINMCLEQISIVLRATGLEKRRSEDEPQQYDQEILIAILEELYNTFLEATLNPTIEQALLIAKSVYNFTMTGNGKQIDKRFIKW